MPKEEFLRRFGAADGVRLGLDLLRDAALRQDSDDVELALVVSFRFGFAAEHLDLLTELAFADWHRSHENVASALQELESPATVEALAHLAKWVPDYLDFDDARALAVKAIWALGSLNDERAKQVLAELTQSDNPVVARNAVEQLQR